MPFMYYVPVQDEQVEVDLDWAVQPISSNDSLPMRSTRQYMPTPVGKPFQS